MTCSIPHAYPKRWHIRPNRKWRRHRKAQDQWNSTKFIFECVRYNILAGYLGNNMEPWFLYGVNMPDERRRAIFRMHREKLPNGDHANFGWPKYASRREFLDGTWWDWIRIDTVMQSHTVSLVCLNSFEIIGASSLFWVKTLVKTLATKKSNNLLYMCMCSFWNLPKKVFPWVWCLHSRLLRDEFQAACGLMRPRRLEIEHGHKLQQKSHVLHATQTTNINEY